MWSHVNKPGGGASRSTWVGSNILCEPAGPWKKIIQIVSEQPHHQNEIGVSYSAAFYYIRLWVQCNPVLSIPVVGDGQSQLPTSHTAYVEASAYAMESKDLTQAISHSCCSPPPPSHIPYCSGGWPSTQKVNWR